MVTQIVVETVKIMSEIVNITFHRLRHLLLISNFDRVVLLYQKLVYLWQ